MPADHEPRDVLQEQQRDATLAAQLDEVGALQRRLREQDAVVADDADRHPPQPRKSRHQRGAVQRLELVEARAVDQPGDDLANVVLLAQVSRHQPLELGAIEQRFLGLGQRHIVGLRRVQVGDDAPGHRQRVRVIQRIVVGNPGHAGVDVGATQLLGRDHLACRRLHQRRSAEEDRALAAHDHGLVGHGRHVGTAGGAGAHHHRDLRDAERREIGLVVENPAEMLPVGENLGLVRQVGAAGIDQIDAGQPVLPGDLLGTQVLLHGQRIIGAALDGGIIGHHHDLAALDPADAGNEPGPVDRLVIDAHRREPGDFQERGAGIDQPGHALARQQLAA